LAGRFWCSPIRRRPTRNRPKSPPIAKPTMARLFSTASAKKAEMVAFIGSPRGAAGCGAAGLVANPAPVLRTVPLAPCNRSHVFQSAYGLCPSEFKISPK
jgi:hypothetical protein